MDIEALLSLAWKLYQGYKKQEAQETLQQKIGEQFEFTLTVLQGLVEIVKAGANEVQRGQLEKLEVLLRTAADEAKSDADALDEDLEDIEDDDDDLDDDDDDDLDEDDDDDDDLDEDDDKVK